mgnify:CR=1 FL=1
MKICFLGAGSTVFAKNILGDCILTPSLGEFEIALHDINEKRLNQSYEVISRLNKNYNGKATITKSLNRKEALKGSDYIINAIQVGGYKPCTVTDFKIPRRYGLWQTIGDTLGIGGIMRALRTIPVLEEFARDIEEVCPDAWFLNYTNPMAMLTGYMQRYTKVKTVGLCHSVQVCVPDLLKRLKMDIDPETVTQEIFGINHQAWLLTVKDKDGNDLYPEIKRRSKGHDKTIFGWLDAVRFEIMNTFGYYVTESSEHNAEYNPWFIKKFNPFLLLKYKVPLNEYPRRCRLQILKWKFTARKIKKGTFIEHKKTHEYGSRIIEALHTGVPYTFNGNVLNTGYLIPNFPEEACVEVPIVADKSGLTPQKCRELPLQCAALNMTNINTHLLTIKASQTRLLEDVVRAAAMDPHTGAVLSLGQIKSMCKALYKKHRKDGYLPEYK